MEINFENKTMPIYARIGNSHRITIPKEVMRYMNLKQGQLIAFVLYNLKEGSNDKNKEVPNVSQTDSIKEMQDKGELRES